MIWVPLRLAASTAHSSGWPGLSGPFHCPDGGRIRYRLSCCGEVGGYGGWVILPLFMSYARFNDEHDDGQLSRFRERLAAEMRAQTGRSS